MIDAISAAKSNARVVFFAGLPAVGKSFHVKSFVKAANAAGREIHLLQWDIARPAFEWSPAAGRYPQIDGVTHPVVCLAVGLWVRDALHRWRQEHPSQEHLVVGELPLVGGRLIELARPIDDDCEPMLASPTTQTFVPVPSREVRAAIEAARAKNLANPRHEREVEDAPINVVKNSWHETYQLGVELGFCDPCVNPPYDPAIYGQVFSHLLRNRHHHIIDIDKIESDDASVYDFEVPATEMSPTEDEVIEMYPRIESEFDIAAIVAAVDQWHMY